MINRRRLHHGSGRTPSTTPRTRNLPSSGRKMLNNVPSRRNSKTNTPVQKIHTKLANNTVESFDYMRHTKNSSIRQTCNEELRGTQYTDLPKSRTSPAPGNKIKTLTTDQECRNMVETLRRKYELQPVNQAFLAWDQDRNGSLDVDEVGRMLNLLG